MEPVQDFSRLRVTDSPQEGAKKTQAMSAEPYSPVGLLQVAAPPQNSLQRPPPPKYPSGDSLVGIGVEGSGAGGGLQLGAAYGNNSQCYRKTRPPPEYHEAVGGLHRFTNYNPESNLQKFASETSLLTGLGGEKGGYPGREHEGHRGRSQSNAACISRPLDIPTRTCPREDSLDSSMKTPSSFSQINSIFQQQSPHKAVSTTQANPVLVQQKPRVLPRRLQQFRADAATQGPSGNPSVTLPIQIMNTFRSKSPSLDCFLNQRDLDLSFHRSYRSKSPSTDCIVSEANVTTTSSKIYPCKSPSVDTCLNRVAGLGEVNLSHSSCRKQEGRQTSSYLRVNSAKHFRSKSPSLDAGVFLEAVRGSSHLELPGKFYFSRPLTNTTLTEVKAESTEQQVSAGRSGDSSLLIPAPGTLERRPSAQSLPDLSGPTLDDLCPITGPSPTSNLRPFSPPTYTQASFTTTQERHPSELQAAEYPAPSLTSKTSSQHLPEANDSGLEGLRSHHNLRASPSRDIPRIKGHREHEDLAKRPLLPGLERVLSPLETRPVAGSSNLVVSRLSDNTGQCALLLFTYTCYSSLE